MKKFGGRLSGCLFLGLVVSACEEELDPFQASDAVFSVFGYLDPAADTQWVRVAPIRRPLINTSDPIDAQVWIEDLGTGRIIEMTPTLFNRPAPNLDGTLYAHNFITAERIDPESTYRLTVQQSDGQSSTAVVSTPSDLSHLTVIRRVGQTRTVNFRNYLRFSVEVGDHVAMVNSVIFPPTESCRERHPPLTGYYPLPGIPITESGYYEVGLFSSTDPGDFPPPCDQGSGGAALRIVRAREPWPFDPETADMHVNAYSNVENGVGFLGGVITRTVPSEGCSFTGTGVPDFCELHYGLETATLLVKPINGWGFQVGFSGFNPATALRRGEETWTRSGIKVPSPDPRSPAMFRFPGLLPGRYHIRIDSAFGLDNTLYCEERTVDLVPGEQVLEIEMVRILAFPNQPLNSNLCREG